MRQRFWYWLMRFAYRRMMVGNPTPDGIPTLRSQEKILEEIDRIIRHWSLRSIPAAWQPLYKGATVGQDVVLFLHSQGVVIKVGSKWPTRCSECNQVGTWVEEDFTLIEPLIKEP